MHGGEEIWECVCASVRSSGFFFFWLRDRCKLKKRKARVAYPGLSRGVVKLTGRPARNAATWRARPLARRLPPRASAAGPLIPFTCLYVVSAWVVSALRLCGHVFTEWALDRV